MRERQLSYCYKDLNLVWCGFDSYLKFVQQLRIIFFCNFRRFLFIFILRKLNFPLINFFNKITIFRKMTPKKLQQKITKKKKQINSICKFPPIYNLTIFPTLFHFIRKIWYSNLKQLVWYFKIDFWRKISTWFYFFSLCKLIVNIGREVIKFWISTSGAFFGIVGRNRFSFNKNNVWRLFWNFDNLSND